MKKLVIAGMISLTACAMPPEKPVETTQIENIPRTQQLAPRTSNYVSITTSRKQILDETVTGQVVPWLDLNVNGLADPTSHLHRLSKRVVGAAHQVQVTRLLVPRSRV